MTGERIQRRNFLSAAVGATVAGVATGSGTPALAQPATTGVPPADLVLKNGNIITVDARSSVAEAIAIAGEKILAVGPDAAMAAHTAPTTRVFDLKGRTVTPGLIDGHAHMDREGLRAVFPSLGQ